MLLLRATFLREILEEWLFSSRRLSGEPSEGKYDAQSFTDSMNKETRLNKIIIANRNIRTMGNSEFNAGIMFETATQFKARTNNLYQYKVENVKYSKNASFSFETHFDKDIFVVTQMPYEKGWEVKANGKNLEVFSAQGGFVGFVAPKGQVKYSMKFYPANLQLGKYMSAVGAAIFLSTYYGYCFLVKNKELEEQYKNLFKLA